MPLLALHASRQLGLCRAPSRFDQAPGAVPSPSRFASMAHGAVPTAMLPSQGLMASLSVPVEPVAAIELALLTAHAAAIQPRHLRDPPAEELQLVQGLNDTVMDACDAVCLQYGLINNQGDVVDKLRRLPNDLTDADFWACAQLRQAEGWDQRVLRSVLGLMNDGLLLRLQGWLGPDLFGRVTSRLRPSNNG